MKTELEFLKGIQPKSLIASGIIGAAIPLSWMGFIILVKEDIFEKWMLIPLTFISLGGAFGAMFFYLMGFFWFPKGTPKLIAILFSTLVYFVAIWLSAVFAFNLTGDWD